VEFLREWLGKDILEVDMKFALILPGKRVL